jgi:hypothetical protein
MRRRRARPARGRAAVRRPRPRRERSRATRTWASVVPQKQFTHALMRHPTPTGHVTPLMVQNPASATPASATPASTTGPHPPGCR